MASPFHLVALRFVAGAPSLYLTGVVACLDEGESDPIVQEASGKQECDTRHHIQATHHAPLGKWSEAPCVTVVGP